MKVSKYNFITTFPGTQERLLFNTLSTAFVALSPETFQQVKALLTRPDESHNHALVDYLFQLGFLVEDERNEFQTILKRSSLGINDNNRIDLIVMPNMNCNFACKYCYEEHSKSSMSDETVRRVKLWLANMIPNIKAILLSWFGGEPMLSYKRIVDIQSHANRLANMHGTEFISHMTTNGYLLSSDRSKILTSSGLFSFQITLDGPPDIHNTSRPLRNGRDTFDRILKNIVSLARSDPRVNIKLRVNYNNRNINRVPELLDIVPAGIRPQIDLVLEHIFGGNYGEYPTVTTSHEQEEAERVYGLAASKGYASTTPRLEPDKLTYCYADRKNQFLVNFNGDVFKCTVDKFDTSKRLGWINEDGIISWECDGGKIDAWHAIPAFEDKCQSCIYAPMCMGGCRKMRYYEGTVGENCVLPFLGLEQRLWAYYCSKRGLVDTTAIATATANRTKVFPTWPIVEVPL